LYSYQLQSNIKPRKLPHGQIRGFNSINAANYTLNINKLKS
jgi:hypothetical protein